MLTNVVNRKMALAVLIVLSGLLVILYSNPEVSGFFGALNEELGNILPIERAVERNVSFHLESDKYNDMELSLKNVSVTITAEEISASLLGSKITAKDSFRLAGFTGKGEIKNNTVYLNGKAKEVSFAGAVIADASLEARSAFILLELDGLSMSRLKLFSINGRLKARNLDITLSLEDVDIRYPRGKFIFNGGLKIDGAANRISTSSKLLLES